jgi:hypothetical protein
MAEDESMVAETDDRVDGKREPYEVADFARKHGLSMIEARGLIERVGNDCGKLDEAAKKLKRR